MHVTYLLFTMQVIIIYCNKDVLLCANFPVKVCVRADIKALYMYNI